MLACRKNNLVFIQNLKCGSTFFDNNLRQSAGFKFTKYEEISWDTDVVFAHILDPIKRRHKGMAEAIAMLHLTDIFLNDTRLRNLLIQTPGLDRHSYPYHWTFGDNFAKIDWIPIQPSKQKTIEITSKFLQHHDIKIDQWNFESEHTSSSKQKQVEQWFELHWNKQEETIFMDEYKNHIWNSFYSDFRLQNWPISIHFKDFYLLPTEIKQVIKNHLPENITCANECINITVEDVPRLTLIGSANHVYAKDIEMFDQIIKKFNPEGQTWEQISWLTKT